MTAFQFEKEESIKLMNDAQENLIEDERIPIGGWGSFKVVTKIDDTGDMSI